LGYLRRLLQWISGAKAASPPISSTSSQGGPMEGAELATATYWAPLLETIADVAFAVVIVALAVELVSGRLAKRFERQIDAARELQIAELKKETSAAQLELAKLKAPRAISPEQRVRISELMHEFAGQEYWGMVASDVADAWDLWREISLALDLAGWKRLPPPGLAVTQYGPPAGIPIAPQAGVMILFAGTSWNALHSRAEALAKVLTEMGVLTGSGPATGHVDSTPNAMAVVIGPKPQ
jgi:hypothetical protein